MAKLDRVKQNIFGTTGPVSEFGQIGSDANGAATNTKDISQIQSLSQYAAGLFSIFPNADEPPIAEEINSMYYMITAQIAYLMQAGIPEWDTNTDYYTGSYIQVSGAIYVSIAGVDPTPNQGNNPVDSPAFWKLLIPGNNTGNYIVYNQQSFNNCIDRVAANQYKIKDEITSLKALSFAGGYLMTGVTSPLSGGDSWGYIETNNCKQIMFESGASIHMGAESGYIEVNTDNCVLNNVVIEGDVGTPTAISRSFLLNAHYVSLNNCIIKNRNTNIEAYGFQGSNIAAHNATSCYKGCKITNFIGSGLIRGFRECRNLVNCSVYNIITTGSIYCFDICRNIANVEIHTVEAVMGFRGFNGCENINNVDLELITVSAGEVYGVFQSDKITGIKMNLIEATSGSSSNGITGIAFSRRISNCELESFNANGGNAIGLDNSDYIANCRIRLMSSVSGVAQGIASGNSITNSETLSNGNHGFWNCLAVSNCLSTGNTTSQYTGTYADWAGTQAAADTAAGGYNG